MQPYLRCALSVSLPLISILAMIWLWRDTGDNERIAALSEGTFWLVLPTLPMFLVLPAMLRHGFTFWGALAVSCALTLALYLVAVWFLTKFGIVRSDVNSSSARRATQTMRR